MRLTVEAARACAVRRRRNVVTDADITPRVAISRVYGYLSDAVALLASDSREAAERKLAIALCDVMALCEQVGVDVETAVVNLLEIPLWPSASQVERRFGQFYVPWEDSFKVRPLVCALVMASLDHVQTRLFIKNPAPAWHVVGSSPLFDVVAEGERVPWYGWSVRAEDGQEPTIEWKKEAEQHG